MITPVKACIHIKNLRLRTYIGFNPEEREKKQDVVINIKLHYQAAQAATTDKIDDAINYKAITKRVISLVESNKFALLEKLTHDILNTVTDHQSISYASVEVDKPHALRFSDSVSLQLTYGEPNG